ncbi:hypothetical protein F4774DRAFT_402488 [Daldinia eschscholtzii]|nr:hypothetical protein F4774DRAFT_402488 [Daldinia eschscholtzii]
MTSLPSLHLSRMSQLPVPVSHPSRRSLLWPRESWRQPRPATQAHLPKVAESARQAPIRHPVQERRPRPPARFILVSMTMTMMMKMQPMQRSKPISRLIWKRKRMRMLKDWRNDIAACNNAFIEQA